MPEIVALLANGWLLGREFFELAALRHLSRQESDALRRRHAGKIYGAGLLIAVLALVPGIDLIAAFFRRRFDGTSVQTSGRKIMNRLVPVLSLCALLAACAAPGGGGTPAHVVLPPAPPEGEPAGTTGLHEAELKAQYGQPAFVRHDGTAQIWRFDGDACKAFFFLYSRDGNTAVWHVETAPPRPEHRRRRNLPQRAARAGRRAAAGFLTTSPSLVLSL